jgi:hypothetical protein
MTIIGGKDLIHRLQGTAELALSGIIGYAAIKFNDPMLGIGSALFAVDGFGDVITGYHHYCGQKAIEGVKCLINKTRKDTKLGDFE